jgi:hypothetical protein
MEKEKPNPTNLNNQKQAGESISSTDDQIIEQVQSSENKNQTGESGIEIDTNDIKYQGRKLAKFMTITASIILASGILMLISSLFTYNDQKLAAVLTGLGLENSQEMLEISSKILLIAIPGSILSLAGLVLTIILWVKQVKFNKKLALIGKKKYFIFPILFIAAIVLDIVISIIINSMIISSRGTNTLTLIDLILVWGVISILITIFLSAFMLKKSIQIKNDFA